MSKDKNTTTKSVSDKEMQLLDPAIKEEFSGVLNSLSAFRQQITMLQNQVRGLEKHVNKRVKVLQREARKSKNKGNRKPSGFAVPSKISNELCEFMASEPVVVQVLEGEGAILKNREVMGATNPAEAAPGTIRAEFAESVGENSVHGSDAPETAAVEISYFFAGLELVG